MTTPKTNPHMFLIIVHNTKFLIFLLYDDLHLSSDDLHLSSDDLHLSSDVPNC